MSATPVVVDLNRQMNSEKISESAFVRSVSSPFTDGGYGRFDVWGKKGTNDRADNIYRTQKTADKPSSSKILDTFISVSLKTYNSLLDDYSHDRLVEYLKLSDQYSKSLRANIIGRLFCSANRMFIQNNYDDAGLNHKLKKYIEVLQEFENSDRKKSDMETFIKRARQAGLSPLKVG